MLIKRYDLKKPWALRGVTKKVEGYLFKYLEPLFKFVPFFSSGGVLLTAAD
jgi:hypothetical protein